MQGFPLIPRAEMHLWQAGRGADLILKDEWRLNQRSLSFSLSPPRFSASRLHLYMHAKSPRLLPHLGWGNRGLFQATCYSAVCYGAISGAVR